MTEKEFNSKSLEVEKRLVEWWQEAQEENELKLDSEAGVFEGMPVIDSKAVMGASFIFEEVLGEKITAKDVRKGGYSSFDDLKNHLIGKFRDKFFKKEED